MSANSKSASAWQIIKSALMVLVLTGLVIVAMLWLLGTFKDKVPQVVEKEPAGQPVGDTSLQTAEMITIPAIESAVGSIEPIHKSEVASKILAKVEKVNVTAGQKVKKGEVLVRLNDEDLQARVRQAKAAVRQARSSHKQAETEFDRVDKLFQQNAATKIEWERARTEMQTTEAKLEEARQRLSEAETVLNYAVIHSPMDGVVVDKKVDEGDMVQPGQVLLTLYDPTKMQLVANVRESLAEQLKVGQNINVFVEALSLRCQGEVSEIVPQAQRASRSFEVKVTGPCPPGVYAGMFGRMRIPLGKKQVLVIPRDAVRSVGQLNMVRVAKDGRLLRRAVQLGQEIDEKVQVLAGLKPGEQVATHYGTATQPAGA